MKCFECKLLVPKNEAIHENGHYFHSGCFCVRQGRQQLIEYICKLFGLKAAGPVIYSQRKFFIERMGYTDQGMLNALRFAYEIKKIKPAKAEERIGIIPSVYEEAQEFFKVQEKRQLNIAKSMEQGLKDNKITITTHAAPSSRPLYDMESLYDLEE